MNTLTFREAMAAQDGNNIILLDDLEFCMPKDQLQTITDLHNDGMDIESISVEVKRNPYEVLIALIHQVKRNRKMRPLAFKSRHRESSLLVPGREQLKVREN